MTDANIASLLAARSREHPEKVAIVESRFGGTRRLTFAELSSAVATTSSELRSRGIGRGDRVLIFVPMSAALYVAMLGCFHAGATAVFVDAWANRRRIDAAVKKAAPRALIGSWKAQLLRIVVPSIRRIPTHLVAGVRPRSPVSSTTSGVSVSVASPERAEPDDVALITFTTGSTGAPKAASRSHGFLLAQHRVLAEHLGLRADDIDMPTLPIFVLNNLALGVTSVIPDFDPRRPAEIEPARIWGQMVSEGVTTTSGSPAFYDRLLSWGIERGERLPVRALFTGGAPVLPPLARRLEAGITGRAEIVYGSTEAEPISAITTTEMLEAESLAAAVDVRAAGKVAEAPNGHASDGVCVGRPVPAISLRIIRVSDEPIDVATDGIESIVLAAWQTGEIAVAGAHVLRGYIDDPESERKAKIRDGDTVWHRTGDAGRLDDQGRLWLMGRVRERVIRDGETWWGAPAEVRALRDPRVLHAAYLGVADAERGQRAMLFVESSGRWTDAERDLLIERVAPHPVDDLRVIDRIPRDPRHASKTDADALRRLI